MLSSDDLVGWAQALVEGIDKRYANGTLRVASTDTFWDEVEDVRRAISLADVSFCCVECGAPWRRVVDPDPMSTGWEPSCVCFRAHCIACTNPQTGEPDKRCCTCTGQELFYRYLRKPVAGFGESTENAERAVVSESTVRAERAAGGESTDTYERAVRTESTVRAERAAVVESTEDHERAVKLESTAVCE